MQNLSIFTRLTSETPKFWVRIQIVCLILSAAMGYVINAHLVPVAIGYILVGLFGGGAAFAQLAVKDGSIVTDALHDPLTILDKLGELQSDFKTVKAAVTDHIPATLTDVASAIAESNAIPDQAPAPVAQAPVVQAVTVPQAAPVPAPVFQLPSTDQSVVA